MGLLAALALAAGCRKASVERPASAIARPGECDAAACLPLAAERERSHDYLGAREALRAGCATGSAEACGRVSRGPYLLSDADRHALARRGCQLGDVLSCEATCLMGGVQWNARIDAARELCPVPGADTRECQLLDEATYDAAAHPLDRDACDRGLDEAVRLYSPERLARLCAPTAPMAGCEAVFSQQPPGAQAFGYADAPEQLQLCERGSALACTHALYTRCQRNEDGLSEEGERRRPCTLFEITELQTTGDGARLVTAARKLCAGGTEEACLALPGTPETSVVTLCQRGYAPAPNAQSRRILQLTL